MVGCWLTLDPRNEMLDFGVILKVVVSRPTAVYTIGENGKAGHTGLVVGIALVVVTNNGATAVSKARSASQAGSRAGYLIRREILEERRTDVVPRHDQVELLQSTITATATGRTRLRRFLTAKARDGTGFAYNSSVRIQQ